MKQNGLPYNGDESVHLLNGLPYNGDESVHLLNGMPYNGDESVHLPNWGLMTDTIPVWTTIQSGSCTS